MSLVADDHSLAEFGSREDDGAGADGDAVVEALPGVAPRARRPSRGPSVGCLPTTAFSPTEQAEPITVPGWMTAPAPSSASAGMPGLGAHRLASHRSISSATRSPAVPPP